MIRCASESQLEQTVIEMVTMRLCSSPFTVRFVEFFQHDLEVYLVMEYCSEGDLGGRLRELRRPPSQEQVLRWFTQLTLGLARIHRMGFLHRDIKPGNIFFGRWDVVKLGDFGLAALGGRLVNSERVAGGLAGTPGFLSPEMLRGEPYNAKTDIWALGCTLYEMLTGRSAFRDLYGGRHQTGGAVGPGSGVLVGAQLPRRHIASHFSPELVDVLALCLDPSPESRPSAAELLQLPVLARTLPLVQDELELLERVTALEDRLGYDAAARSLRNVTARYMPTNRFLRLGAGAAVRGYEMVCDVGTHLFNAVVWLGTGVFSPQELPTVAKTRLATDSQLNDPPTRAALAATTALWVPLLLAALGLLAGALSSLALRYWRLFAISALCPPVTALCVQIAQRQLRRPQAPLPPPRPPRITTNANTGANTGVVTRAGAPVVAVSAAAVEAIDGARARARSAVAFARELLAGASVPSFLSVPAPPLHARLSTLALPVTWPTLARLCCFLGAAVWAIELLSTLVPPGRGVWGHLFYGALSLFGAAVGYWIACVARAATANAAAAALAGGAGQLGLGPLGVGLGLGSDSDSEDLFDTFPPTTSNANPLTTNAKNANHNTNGNNAISAPSPRNNTAVAAMTGAGAGAGAATLPAAAGGTAATARPRGTPSALRGAAGQRLVHDCALYAAAGVAVAVAVAMGAAVAPSEDPEAIIAAAAAASAAAAPGGPDSAAAKAAAAAAAKTAKKALEAAAAKAAAAAAASPAAAKLAAAAAESSARFPALALLFLLALLTLAYAIATAKPVRPYARRALAALRNRARAALLPPALTSAAALAATLTSPRAAALLLQGTGSGTGPLGTAGNNNKVVLMSPQQSPVPANTNGNNAQLLSSPQSSSSSSSSSASAAATAAAEQVLKQAPLFAVTDAVLAFVEQAWQPLSAAALGTLLFFTVPHWRFTGTRPTDAGGAPVPMVLLLLLPVVMLLALGTIARDARHEGGGLVSASLVRFVILPSIVTFFLFLFVQSFLVSIMNYS